MQLLTEMQGGRDSVQNRAIA